MCFLKKKNEGEAAGTTTQVNAHSKETSQMKEGRGRKEKESKLHSSVAKRKQSVCTASSIQRESLFFILTP